MIELAYGSGLRVSELVTLPLADVNLHGGFVRVTGKGGETRVVPIHHHATEKKLATSVRQATPNRVTCPPTTPSQRVQPAVHAPRHEPSHPK